MTEKQIKEVLKSMRNYCNSMDYCSECGLFDLCKGVNEFEDLTKNQISDISKALMQKVRKE